MKTITNQTTVSIVSSHTHMPCYRCPHLDSSRNTAECTLLVSRAFHPDLQSEWPSHDCCCCCGDSSVWASKISGLVVRPKPNDLQSAIREWLPSPSIVSWLSNHQLISSFHYFYLNKFCKNVKYLCASSTTLCKSKRIFWFSSPPPQTPPSRCFYRAKSSFPGAAWRCAI